MYLISLGGSLMGTIGIDVRECDLEAVSTKIKLLDGQIWYLNCGYAERFCYLFENGKQVPVQVKRVPLSEIYPKIRFICDLKENVIAERACVGARLRTTRKNNWLSVNKKVNPDRTLYVYQLVQGIQNREHAKKMLDYFYSQKQKK